MRSPNLDRSQPKAAYGSLDQLLAATEGLRMMATDSQLIEEAVAINHAQVSEKTAERYRDHLCHLAGYLDSAHSVSFYPARRRHLTLFMKHLEKPGGATPHSLRVPCRWCNQRGYPDGRQGPGWSASYRKSYLSAARFMYTHFAHEEDLPDIDPTSRIESPKVIVTPQYTPSSTRLRQSSMRLVGPVIAYWRTGRSMRLPVGRPSHWLAGVISTSTEAIGTWLARGRSRTALSCIRFCFESSGDIAAGWLGSTLAVIERCAMH